ncbi:MAG: hypothetical protein KDA77_12330, partial [Planctomycetaceae bacterium]|nr:hypothetical protein [Planctomycetaceae bacterium]
KPVEGGQYSAVDAESIAAFVEDNMNAEQRAAFEVECWDQSDLLREVIAAYQAEHGTVAAVGIPAEYAQQASQRMRDFLATQTQPVTAALTEGDYLAPIADPQQTVWESAATAASEADQVRLEIRPSHRPSRKQQKGIFWLTVTVAVVVIIILPTYFVFVHNTAKTTITKSPSPVPHPSVRNQNKSDWNQPLDVELTPELAVAPESHPGRHVPPDAPLMVPRTPDQGHELNTKPLVAQKPLQSDPSAPVKLSVEWTKLAGIIGFKPEGSALWKGILAEGGTLKTDQPLQLELRTLPFSWLQGTLDSGQELVLDSGSEVQLSIQKLRQTVIELQLISGNVAFVNLQAGNVLRLQQQRQEWLVEVKQDGTSVGFVQRDENRRELMAFAGEVLITDPLSARRVSLQANQMLVIKDQAVSLPVKLTGNQNWRSKPSGTLKLNRALIERLNQSENLLADLMTVPAGQSGLEVLASTHLGFALDPTVAVPRATSSPSELQRTAAIEWLLAAKDDPTTRDVWNQIKVIENTGTPAVSVQTWFQMAQRKVPGNQQLLQELSMGLGAQQPLFVRQCAIHFLRQLTRLRLAEYDPGQPTPAAINSVRQKLRRAAGNTGSGRPAGNANRRQQ